MKSEIKKLEVTTNTTEIQRIIKDYYEQAARRVGGGGCIVLDLWGSFC